MKEPNIIGGKPSSPNNSSLILVAGLCMGIGTGVLGYQLYRSKAVRLIPSVNVTARAAPGAQPPNAKGLDSASVVLEEFSDFQCPPCKNLYQKLNRIEAEYKSDVRVVFRHCPIPSLHKNALAAARAAEAAGLQGRFWDMHDRLFENQQTWASSSDVKPIFASYAGSLQLDVERFRKDMDGAQAKSRVQADQQRADSISVPGTPVVLVNNQQVPPQSLSYEGLHAAVEKELRRTAACSGLCTAPLETGSGR